MGIYRRKVVRLLARGAILQKYHLQPYFCSMPILTNLNASERIPSGDKTKPDEHGIEWEIREVG